jgi:hypothetical protein
MKTDDSQAGIRTKQPAQTIKNIFSQLWVLGFGNGRCSEPHHHHFLSLLQFIGSTTLQLEQQARQGG